MYRLARWFALCVIAILCFVQIVLTTQLGKAHANGDDMYRAWAPWLACALILGLCICFVRFVAKAEKAAMRIRHETEYAEAMQRGDFEAKGRPLLLTVGCLLFTAMGAAMVYGGATIDAKGWLAVPGAALLLFGSLCTYEILRQALRPGPMLRIDGSGIDHAMFGRIGWRDIHGLHLQQIQTRHTTISTLVLGVREPHRFIARAPLLFRLGKFGWKRQRPAFGSLPIGLNPLNKDPTLIHQVATTFRDQLEPARLAYWHPAISEPQLSALLKMQALNDEMNAARDTATNDQSASFLKRSADLQAELESTTNALLGKHGVRSGFSRSSS